MLVIAAVLGAVIFNVVGSVVNPQPATLPGLHVMETEELLFSDARPEFIGTPSPVMVAGEQNWIVFTIKNIGTRDGGVLVRATSVNQNGKFLTPRKEVYLETGPNQEQTVSFLYEANSDAGGEQWAYVITAEPTPWDAGDAPTIQIENSGRILNDFE